MMTTHSSHQGGKPDHFQMIGSKGKKFMFSIRINSIFRIAGRGIVMAGKVESGRVRAGAKAVIRTPTKSLDTVLSGLEQNREIVSSAGEGENVAIMIADFDPNTLNDGIEVSRTEEGFPSYRVVELVIEEASKSWWEFWK